MSKLKHLLLFASVSAVSSLQAGSYIQNFDAAGDGATDLNDGSTLRAAPFLLGSNFRVVENNFPNNQEIALRLTEDQATQGGSAGYILPDLDPGQAINEFDLTFNSLMKDADGNPADGFSFNFGDLNLDSPGTFVEEGWTSQGGDVLTVSWDTFDSGSDDIFGRVAVFLNGSEVAGMDNTVNNVVESTLDAPFQEVAISWSEIDGLFVDYAGTSVYANDAVNLTTEAGYRFAFVARTGGFDLDTFIDDVNLTTEPVPESASFGVLLALAAGGFTLMRRSRHISAARLALPSSQH